MLFLPLLIGYTSQGPPEKQHMTYECVCMCVCVCVCGERERDRDRDRDRKMD